MEQIQVSCGRILALLFYLSFTVSICGSVQYYVKASDESSSCFQGPCLSLSQVAANFTHRVEYESESDVDFVFLSGNHSLDREMSISQFDYFSMRALVDPLENKADLVIIQCASKSARIAISNISFAAVKSIHFVGCGSITIINVRQLIVEDTIFQGVSDVYNVMYSYTALELNMVAHAKVVRSKFLWSTRGSSNTFSRCTRFKTFTRNLALLSGSQRDLTEIINGGAMRVVYSDVLVSDSIFDHNGAKVGAALLAHHSNVSIAGCTYSHNRAEFGGAIAALETSANIFNSTFRNNIAECDGGVMNIVDGSLGLSNSTFLENAAFSDGGAMMTLRGSFRIADSNFTNNTAAVNGGVIRALYGKFGVAKSVFGNNSAYNDGGVVSTTGSLFNITTSNFTNNGVHHDGGVVRSYLGRFRVSKCHFISNRAGDAGGVVWLLVGSINLKDTRFINNAAFSNGGVMLSSDCSIHIVNCTFARNLGSLYTFNGNLTIAGNTTFTNNSEPPNKPAMALTREHRQGGAVTCFQSTMMLNGMISFTNNQARHGGAILAAESKIVLYGTTTIANNTATVGNGGGISLHQSELRFIGSCTISENYAMRGGGVHAKSSTITLHQKGTLQFVKNNAENGSGIYLEVNPTLYLLKNDPFDHRDLLIFTGNHANYGGAMYVADNTNSGACSPNVECFIQTLALHQAPNRLIPLITTNIKFSENTATEHGPNMFGGLVDRCIPSPFAEVYLKYTSMQYYNGVTYLKALSNVEMDSIASPPVRVCFCNNESEPDCSYQPPPIKVKKGEAFNVSLIAVDQVNHSVVANIISFLAHDGVFSEGQQTQSVGRNCTDLTFNVLSPSDSESINLFADGPCGSTELSIRNLDIQFLKCTCPIGFQPNSGSVNRCECICDSKLSPYITDCNSTTSSVIRESTNLWITYINDTDPPGYVIHPNCPFDYCQSQTVNTSINLNLPNGADAQCTYNRTGTLCGACQEHLSLSLGSSRCLPCPSHWPAVFAVIILAAIVAGILLVTALLALNMTVAVGLINGFIFYANIVSANSAVFFPSSEPSLPTVFVAWLNLDLGIDVCFFDGLDTYIKTWLQLAFPMYIISLVVFIIIVSKRSPRFVRLIGRRDPIATLATLILLSYAKLLSITITVLSFAIIDYPDGSQETVWLPDGNVKYFRGKHAALVIVALLIILVGVPYTILLFLWQWLVRAPRWKIFKWTRDTKLNAFIVTYHIPYNSKYRYWTGLLLLVRVVLYITVSVTASAKPRASLLTTILLVGGILLNGCLGIKMYKKSVTNILEMIVYFNLLALSAFSLYHSKTDAKGQTAVAYTSTSMTLVLFVGVVTYHCALLIGKQKITEVGNQSQSAVTECKKCEVTHSVIEISNAQ